MIDRPQQPGRADCPSCGRPYIHDPKVGALVPTCHCQSLIPAINDAPDPLPVRPFDPHEEQIEKMIYEGGPVYATGRRS